MIQLQMEKAGEFRPILTPVEGHVGKCDMPEHDTYRYHVTVCATDEHLTPEGFIIENGQIQGWFETAYNGQSEMSCERMASHAAHGLAELILSNGVELLFVEARIGGSNGAWLIAKWSR